MLAGLRGDRSVNEVCREHEISNRLFYSWRDKLLEGRLEALAGKEERTGERELRGKMPELERVLVARPTSSRSRAKHCEAGSERARSGGQSPTWSRLRSLRTAGDNQTDGYRMVTAFVHGAKLGRPG